MKFDINKFCIAVKNKYILSGKTYFQLEEDTGISANQLCRIVRGGISQSKFYGRKYIPDVTTYAKLCKWLNVSLNSFFDNKKKI